MKSINAILNQYGILLVATLLFLVVAGCDALNNQEPEVAALSQEDLETASSILAESLSDQDEGLMANLNDMTADVSANQLSYTNRRFWSNPGLRPCRGENRAFEKSYDDSTGVHSIHYVRSNEAELCTKNVEVNLNYTFTDVDGNFIASPRIEKEQVAEIAFTGSRVGSGSFVSRRGSRTVSFEQVGEWNLSGLQSDVAALRGSQSNDGSYEYTRPDTAGVEVTRSGNYHLEFNTVDVTISQTSGEASDLETQITGTIQYTMSMEKVDGGRTEVRDVEGTIELEGNGRALLRFLGLRKIYRVTLQDGDITETDGETGGDG